MAQRDGPGNELRSGGAKAVRRAKRAAGREKDLRILPELEGLLEAESE